MLNQIVLVGRLVSNIGLKEREEGKYANITLAVPRAFKNAEGEYETDFIPVVIFGGIAENTANFCNKGDLIGVKGRVESINKENVYSIQIIAEKITFLSSTKEQNN